MHSDRQLGVQAFQHGADGFVSKDSSSEVLCTAIRRVLGGRKYVSEHLAEQLLASADKKIEGFRHETLSQREQEIFRFLIRGDTPSEIAAALGRT